MYDELKELNETLAAVQKELKDNGKTLVENAFVEVFEKHQNLSSVRWVNKIKFGGYQLKLTGIPNSKFNDRFYDGNLKKASFKGLPNEKLKAIKDDVDSLFKVAGHQVLSTLVEYPSKGFVIATINGLLIDEKYKGEDYEETSDYEEDDEFDDVADEEKDDRIG